MRDLAVALLALGICTADFLMSLWRPESDAAHGLGSTAFLALVYAACWFWPRRNR